MRFFFLSIQVLQPYTGNDDVSILVKDSRAGHDTANNIKMLLMEVMMMKCHLHLIGHF
jgi:hypothetical protein